MDLKLTLYVNAVFLFFYKLLLCLQLHVACVVALTNHMHNLYLCRNYFRSPLDLFVGLKECQLLWLFVPTLYCK
jgi:hypothetical protein